MCRYEVLYQVAYWPLAQVGAGPILPCIAQPLALLKLSGVVAVGL